MRNLLLVIALSVLAAPVLAHEYWFEPDTFFLKPNEKTNVHLYVGDGLVKDREERVYQAEKTEMFQLFGVSTVKDLKRNLVEGAIPIYNFSATNRGSYLLAMERNWSYIKLGSAEFEDYLRADGIEYVIAERAKRGESKNEGRERYARFIKSLLQVGDKTDVTFKKNLGMKLEIIPLENPYLKKVGNTLAFKVFFNGKPLANRTIFADNRENVTQKTVTGKDGKFSVKLGKSGLWLIRLVIIQRCKTDCGEADWESFWGAFSFGVR